MVRALMSMAVVAVALVATAASRWAVEPLARSVAKELDGAARALSPSAPQAAPLVFIEADVPQAAPTTPARDGTEPKRVVAWRAPVRKAAALPKKGLFVGANKVLALANAGARPTGVVVAARGSRPAGVALVGVGGLGVGLRDGDILTHAGGRPATSVGDVVGVVLGARAQRAGQISGRFWRNGEPWNLVVEQPYVRPAPRRESPSEKRSERAAPRTSRERT